MFIFTLGNRDSEVFENEICTKVIISSCSQELANCHVGEQH